MSVGWVNGQETLIISEVTDPGDVANAKYVELYNATDADIDLSTWQIRRYANGNTSSTNASLAGTLASGETYVVANNETDFTTQYGFAPDQSSSAISGNGDDVYELFDGTSVIDIYGEVGVDGTGTAWEYENSRAVRVATVGSANTTWTASEWTIAAADVADMTPGVHTCDFPVDTDPPVPTFDPSDGATGVAIDVNPTITFDETIYTTGGVLVDDSNVKSLISLMYGAAIPASFTATISGTTITIVPDTDLEFGENHSLTIQPVEDELGNEMDAVASINFTTIAEDAPSIDLTSTHAGNTYYGGEDVTVTWTSENVTTLDLEVWIPSESVWGAVESGLTAADGTITTAPDADTDFATTYKLRLKDADSETYSAESGEFTIRPVATDLATVRAYADGDEFRYDGEAVITYARDNRNQKYIQDDVAAVLIDDDAAVLHADYDIGHVITGLVASKSTYNDIVQVVPIEDIGAPTETAEVVPFDRTVETITTDDQSMLIRIPQAEFTETGSFSTYTNYDITDPTAETITFRTNFTEVDYIGEAIPEGEMKALVALVGEYNSTPQLTSRSLADFDLYSSDATLSTFTLGEEDVTGLTDLEVADPVNDAGATLYVTDITGFEGIVIDATNSAATVTVELNGSVVDPGIYATQALANGDVVVATVEAEDGTIAYYKVTIIEENRELEITGPALPATFQTGDDVTFTWTSANIDTVNIYVVDTEEAHLINEEGVIDATLGEYTYTIANGDFGTFTIRIADASDETFFDETFEEVTVNDIQHPEGVEFYPAMGAVDVPLGFTLSVLFDEDVVAGTGNFTIYDASDDSEVLNFTEADFTINEDVLTISVTGLEFETEYYILADAGIIEDHSGNAVPVLDDPTTWTFTTINEPDYELFFSEYIEGSSNNKAIEIYNPGNIVVDLTPYVVKLGSNGDDWGNTLDLEGTLGAKEVYIIANSGAVQEILDLADVTSDVTYYNGDDALGLFNNDELIDVIGTQGDTVIWEVAGVSEGTKEHTLVRKTGIYNGNTNWTESAGTNEEDSEWIVYDQDYFDNLGVHSTMPSSEAEILDFTFGLAIDYEDAVIDSELATVEISVIKGTDVTALAPMIIVSDGATIDPESGDTLDFTNPYMYTVTAQDGTKKYWTVTVTELTELSDKANILDVQLAGVDSININDTDTTVTIYAPYGFDVTSVKPEFTVSAGATIADTAAARDFTDPQVYVVTAQDGSTIKNWEVAIDVVEATAATIYDIQYTDDASGDSPYLGQIVLTSGIVTYINGSNVWIQDGSGAWNGVMIYSSDMAGAVAIGDEVEFAAEVDEYYNLTELKNVVGLTVVSSGNDLPAAAEISTLEANDEDYESVLVKVSDATCTNADTENNYGMFVVDDGTGEILIDDVFYAFTPTLDNVYDITGIADYSYDERKILPRNDDDIVDVTTGINTPDGVVSMNVYPNPSNGQFTFEMNASKAGTFKVEIINIQGQVVYQKQITQDGFYRESIDISDKARGMYYIRLNDGQSMKIAKIMIQ